MVSQALIRSERDAEFPNDPYAWKITRDRDFELTTNPDYDTAVGVAGPGLATEEMLDRLHNPAGENVQQFRLYDEGDIDDCSETGLERGHPDYGMVYEGLIWTHDGEPSFGPLDDYGTPNFGCTEIRYLEDGKWVTL